MRELVTEKAGSELLRIEADLGKHAAESLQRLDVAFLARRKAGLLRQLLVVREDLRGAVGEGL